jgi:hypothetical protein
MKNMLRLCALGKWLHGKDPERSDSVNYWRNAVLCCVSSIPYKFPLKFMNFDFWYHSIIRNSIGCSAAEHTTE